jgi:cytosine/adenosine deaminase-related metal-dependent hydrolase
MILKGVNIVGQDDEIKTISIDGSTIRHVSPEQSAVTAGPGETIIEFDRALAFPGLINSHDHLDFDLFPLMGNRVYLNYIEWGSDIQATNKEAIDSILRIPKQLRFRWGVYKNLLAGVTTVVNHGKKMVANDHWIDVFQHCQSLHSVDREKNWRLKLNRLYRQKEPVVIHIGEGTDPLAGIEINRLLRWNLFNRDIIGIHGVAMNEKQASLLKALVWCPASNHFLLKKTAAIDFLKHRTTVLFGTDSTLTAPWNIWEQLRLARSESMMSDEELFNSLTISAAGIWRLPDRAGLTEDKRADIVVARGSDNENKWNRFYELNPEDLLLVVHCGNIRLFDKILFDQLKKEASLEARFSKIYINGSEKYVEGDVSSLVREIRRYNADTPFPISCD